MATSALDLEPYRPHIEAALAYAGESHRYDDVAAMIAAGDLQVWPGPASVIVTELIRFPRHMVCNIFLAGCAPGHLSELQAMLPEVLAWAETKGCAKATLFGRRGWQRTFLADQGWTTSPMVLMEKAL